MKASPPGVIFTRKHIKLYPEGKRKHSWISIAPQRGSGAQDTASPITQSLPTSSLGSLSNLKIRMF